MKKILLLAIMLISVIFAQNRNIQEVSNFVRDSSNTALRLQIYDMSGIPDWPSTKYTTDEMFNQFFDDSSNAIRVAFDFNAAGLGSGSQLTTEEVQDIVGAMFTDNLDTLIGSSYIDGTGKITLVVKDSLDQYNNAVSKFLSDSDTTATLATRYDLTLYLTLATVNDSVTAIVDSIYVGGLGYVPDLEFITHTGNTSNPHTVTWTQVRNDSVLWNAKEIFTIPVDTAGLTDNYILKYDLAGNTWDVEADAGAAAGENNTASNLAGAGKGIFKDKSAVDLRFKRLKAGTDITITDNTDSLIIASTATDDQTLDTLDVVGNNLRISIEDDGEAALLVDLSQLTAVLANTAKVSDDSSGVAEIYGPGYNGDLKAVTKNNIYDYLHLLDTDDDGDIDNIDATLWATKQGLLNNSAGLYAALSDVARFLEDMVDDTTPQLGGDLDIQGYEIEGVDATELGYLDGVTSDIQTQFGAKADSGAVGYLAQDESVTGAWDFVSLAVDNLFLDGNDISSTSGNMTFNIAGDDEDFHFSGTSANLLYLNAGTNRVGIGTASPDEKLEVSGKIKTEDFIPQRPYIDVRYFGAHNDSSATWNNPLIQQSINYGARNQVNVYAPGYFAFTRLFFYKEATYNPTYPDSVTYNGKLVFYGDGASSKQNFVTDEYVGTTLVSTEDDSASINISGQDAAGSPSLTFSNFVIRDMSIVQNTTSEVIKIFDVNNMVGLERVAVEQQGTGVGSDGIVVIDVWTTELLKNVFVYGNGGGTGITVKADSTGGGGNVLLTNANSRDFDFGFEFGNLVHGTGKSIGIDCNNCQAIGSDSIGVRVGYGAAATWNQGHIEGVTNADSMAIGIFATAGSYIHITGKSVFTGNDVGTQIGTVTAGVANGANAYIVGNIYSNTIEYAVKIYAKSNSKNVTFSNNQISQKSGEQSTNIWVENAAHGNLVVQDNYHISGTVEVENEGAIDVYRTAGNYKLSDVILGLNTGELTVVDGDTLGIMQFKAPLETSGGDANLVSAAIWAEADNTFSSTNNQTDLVFATASSETATEKMRLDKVGQLGIGTASPAAKLNLYNDDAVVNDPQFRIENDGAGDASMEFGITGTLAWRMGIDNSDADKFKIGVAADLATSLLTMNTIGDVGIGVADPDTKLEVLNAGNQLKLSFDGTDNAVFAVDTDGNLTVTPSGSKTIFANNVTVNGNNALEGHSTGRSVMRVIQYLLIENGTNANTIKCTTVNEYNHSAISAVDNIAKGATTSGYTLSADGTELTIENSILEGTVVGVSVAYISFATGEWDGYSSSGIQAGGDIFLKLFNDGAWVDWTAAADVPLTFYIRVVYITSS